MREHGLKARSARIYRANPGHHAFYATFENKSLKTLATAPDRVWVGDVTYLRVGKQRRYLAVVMDKYSRRIIGWAWGKDRTAQLTLKALNRAVRNRRPRPGLIFHSDRGIEYSAFVYRDRLIKLGITQSMNRPRYMNDNAFMESFSIASNQTSTMDETTHLSNSFIRSSKPIYRSTIASVHTHHWDAYLPSPMNKLTNTCPLFRVTIPAYWSLRLHSVASLPANSCTIYGGGLT